METMFNNYLICEDTTEETVGATGFTTKSNKLFKTVKVLYSNEEDVPVGCEVRISVNAGGTDELGLVIRRTDIIYIL